MMGVAMASNSGSSGRITANNSLKHMASLLLQKLRDAQGGCCNLIQVATEIHAQAQDKLNATLRRIYDVVNVCEGAGVLVRTGHSSPTKYLLPASDSRIRKRIGERILRGGAEIQWLGGSLGEDDCTESEIPYLEDEKRLLEIEKGQILDRISQKKRLCDTLSMQVDILQNLLDQNQARCRLYPADNRIMAQGRRNVSEVASEIDSADVSTDSEEYCDVDDFRIDYFVDEQRPCPAKRLHLPFVILATTPEANVNVHMNACQVHLELDRNYRLMDHTHVIRMLPDVRVYLQQ